MKITNITKQNFKGYDAAPIKNIYLSVLEANDEKDLFDDIESVANRENIGLWTITGDRLFKGREPETWVGRYPADIWLQDRIFFTEGKEETKVHPARGLLGIHPSISKDFEVKSNIKTSDTILNTECGNFFVGKKENGEKYVLAGVESASDAKKIAELQNIKKENIHIIPQPAFHIDMFVRPVGFPYILVHDEELALKNVDKLNTTNEAKTRLKKEIQSSREYILRGRKYISGKELAKELEKQGFKPILIGGIYGTNVNFINALVHKRNDGNLVYITNGSENLSREKTQLQKIFEQDLKAKVPNVAKVDFILGEKAKITGDNVIGDLLMFYQGGVHCLAAEEPDFEKWA